MVEKNDLIVDAFHEGKKKISESQVFIDFVRKLDIPDRVYINDINLGTPQTLGRLPDIIRNDPCSIVIEQGENFVKKIFECLDQLILAETTDSNITVYFSLYDIGRFTPHEFKNALKKFFEHYIHEFDNQEKVIQLGFIFDEQINKKYRDKFKTILQNFIISLNGLKHKIIQISRDGHEIEDELPLPTMIKELDLEGLDTKGI